MKFPSFKIKKQEEQDDPSRLAIKPYRDWRIIFSVFAAALLCAIALHVYVFLQVNAGTIFQESPTESVTETTLKVDLLNKVMDHYGQKAARMQALLEAGN